MVPSGDLSFSVTLFTILAMATLIVLWYRRYSPSCGYAELGGRTGSKYFSAAILMTLWITYIVLSALHTYQKIDFDF